MKTRLHSTQPRPRSRLKGVGFDKPLTWIHLSPMSFGLTGRHRRTFQQEPSLGGHESSQPVNDCTARERALVSVMESVCLLATLQGPTWRRRLLSKWRCCARNIESSMKAVRLHGQINALAFYYTTHHTRQPETLGFSGHKSRQPREGPRMWDGATKGIAATQSGNRNTAIITSQESGNFSQIRKTFVFGNEASTSGYIVTIYAETFK